MSLRDHQILVAARAIVHARLAELCQESTKAILRIALPSIVSNITVPLLGLVDVAITGHLGTAAYIDAIALGGMLFNVVYWLFAFLRMGTSGMTSQALGRHDLAETARLLARSQAVGMSIAITLLVLQIPLFRLGMLVMQPSDEVFHLTRVYFSICIWGAPAMLGLFGLNGWFLGMQNSRAPMVVAVVQNLVNIICSLVFVFGLGMRIEGVALGTLIAQWCGFLLAVLLCWRHYRRLFRYPILKLLMPLSSYGRFFSINRDIFFRTICLVSVMLFFTSAGSWQGDVMLAVNTLLMQLYLLVSYVMDGFANAAEAISGKCWGANDRKAFRDTVRRSFQWGGAVTGAFTLLYAFGGEPFLRLLTDEPSVVAATRDYVIWACLIPVCSIGAFIWDGVFIGITASRYMFVSSLAAAVVFFALYAILIKPLGNHGLWLAYMAFLITRGAVQTWLYFRILSRPSYACRGRE